MESQIEKFVLEFFDNLKCNVEREGNNLIIDNVPKSFQDIYGERCPYKLSFKEESGLIFAGKGSRIWNAINKYLDNVGKTTILKIDFESNPLEEIKKRIDLGNCNINNAIEKKASKFFTRFTFKTSFHYLNEVEHLVNEIYVYEGEVVKGDLSGYKIVEGDVNELSQGDLDSDYKIAREELKEQLKNKTQEIANEIKSRLEGEIERIKGHYNKYLGEIGGDLNNSIEKIKELELKLRTAEGEEAEQIKSRLGKLKKSLLKIGNDESINKIIKEQDFTIKDAIHKHSLNIDNKLLNTTLVCYPLFCFNLYLKGNNSGRYIDFIFNPLTKEINKVHCENCNKILEEINLCSSGHLSCKDCLKKCGECHEVFCEKCLKRFCSVCGKDLCKNCSMTCLTCGKYVCPNHLRKDCVSGEERCTNCLRACLRCHGLALPRYFGESIDSSKVCQKCLGEEKRQRAIKEVFKNQ